MKLLLALAATLFAAMQPIQTNTQEAPDLIVLRFSCGQQQGSSRMIRSVQEPDAPKNEPIRIDQTVRNEPQEVINRRDLQERRAEMRTAEINATLSKERTASVYFYRLEIRNAGVKTMKSFAWSYQPGDSPDPSDRHFFCVVKAKPNEGKTFELFTPLAPSRIIDVSKVGDKVDRDLKDKVIINKIEYMDGSVWKRPGWNAAMFSAEATEKVASGKCIGL